MACDIFKRFIDAEFKTDWAKALAEHGDSACLEGLERTDSQRRADALFEIFMRAATNYGPGVRPTVVTNIVLDQATFERELRRTLGGDRPKPQSPAFHGKRTHGHHGRKLRMLLDRMRSGSHAMPNRSHHRLLQHRRHRKETKTRRRVYLPRQRGTRLRETQPIQRTRILGLARPQRPMAHLPTRRHRNRISRGIYNAEMRTRRVEDGALDLSPSVLLVSDVRGSTRICDGVCAPVSMSGSAIQLEFGSRPRATGTTNPSPNPVADPVESRGRQYSPVRSRLTPTMDPRRPRRATWFVVANVSRTYRRGNG